MQPQEGTARQVLSVRQLNQQANGLLQDGLGSVWVEGEISNFARPASGHWYFTLKDAHAQVRCAMFRGRNYRVTPSPENGMQVLIRARAGVYETRGEYQLVVDALEPAGRGRLEQQFEELKQKLLAEGLFDAARKRDIPQWIRCAGIVTSPGGAVLQDILTVLARRFPAMGVTVYPTPVQGSTAASAIVAAIEKANLENNCEVLLVGRGGGSLEDLWPFNEERVARAIYESSIPVISCVGHETDFSIADFVADLRAPTPSAAAEIISPDQYEIRSQLDACQQALQDALKRRLAGDRQQLAHLSRRLKHPRNLLAQQQQQILHLRNRLQGASQRRVQLARQQLQREQARLQLGNPSSSVRQFHQQLEYLHDQLLRSLPRRLELDRQRLSALARSLHQISPLATLDRGYAVVRTEDGHVVTDSKQVSSGARVQARLARGELHCLVEQCIQMERTE